MIAAPDLAQVSVTTIRDRAFASAMRRRPDAQSQVGERARLSEGDAPPSTLASHVRVRDARLRAGSPSVECSSSRTALPHGLSSEEVERIAGAVQTLRVTGLKCVYLVLGDELLNLPMKTAREVIARFTSRIVLEQGRAGLPKLWLRVLETKGGLHANFAFPATPGMIAKLRASAEFKPFLKGLKAIQWIYSWNGLTERYLPKERVPYCRHDSRLAPRERGSHRLEGGGDRVRLSDALREDALAAGLIEPWARTNANVTKPPKPARKARAAARASVRPEPARSPEPPSPAVPADPEAQLSTSHKGEGTFRARPSSRSTSPEASKAVRIDPVTRPPEPVRVSADRMVSGPPLKLEPDNGPTLEAHRRRSYARPAPQDRHASADDARARLDVEGFPHDPRCLPEGEPGGERSPRRWTSDRYALAPAAPSHEQLAALSHLLRQEPARLE